MRKDAYLVAMYCFAIVVFGCVIALSQRGYQDTWILQDILPPTIIFIICYVAVFIGTNDNRLVAIIASLFVVVLNAIPGLKYQLFYGTFDSAAHYGFTNSLLSSGHVPQTGFYAPFYGDYPGMHILMGSLSIVLGIPTDSVIKLFPSIVYGTIPVMTYFATNHTFDKRSQGAILIASGLPTITNSYVLGGSTLGLALYFAFICVLLRTVCSQEHRLPNSTILLVFGYALLFSHAVTALYVLFSLVILSVFSTLYGLRDYRVLAHIRNIALVFLISFGALQVFISTSLSETMIEALKRALLGESRLSPVPQRFFALPMWARLQFVAVIGIKDIIMVTLSIVGILVLIVAFKRYNNPAFRRFYLPLFAILAGLVLVVLVQLISGFGETGYERPLSYGLVFAPFLMGLVLWQMRRSFNRPGLRLVLVGALLFVSISISLIQVFPYQAMVPTGRALSNDLPDNEYVTDLRMVNTICNVDAILFAERYSPPDARVASDIVTRWQIYGFTNETFSSRHIWASPLETQGVDWDIFVLHYDGPAGSLNEKIENRTHQRIRALVDTAGDLVYSSGGCFVLSASRVMNSSRTNAIAAYTLIPIILGAASLMNKSSTYAFHWGSLP
jgi:hypothetical protein